MVIMAMVVIVIKWKGRWVKDKLVENKRWVQLLWDRMRCSQDTVTLETDPKVRQHYNFDIITANLDRFYVQ